ncbi:MAG: peptidoglycan DD-metalloendopeptidase family protein [Deltaproteobacteria bacterium]|nr:peptidoglycan DD-metalloendopeptidase family protein [Deltaproteobacteria bacterium]MBT4525355.1 peptidoglycan DD-metalloendopeptidase family protein [Deltaproteobacteria bacterium]
MLEKFFTLVIIPQKTAAVKKRRIPALFVIFMVLLLIGLIAAWMWIMIDYLSIRSQLVSINKLQLEFEEKEKQIKIFNEKYDKIQMNFEHLKSLDYKLRSVTSLERDKKNKRQKMSEQEIANQKIQAQQEGILSIIASNGEKIISNFNDKEIKFKNLEDFYSEIKNPLKKVPSQWPSKGLLINGYGVKADPYTNQILSHFGINIATNMNANVRTTADGMVLFVGKDDELSNLIVIDHGNGFVTRYGFITNPEIEEGDLVQKNDIIAKVANIGTSSDYRLYYEVVFNGITQNPVPYITEEKL